MADIEVRLDHVTKAFGDVVAVDDLSLEIGDGEFFSMLGPSGCGKTTTLRMIGGFEDPTSGSVWLKGTDVTDLPPYKRDVNTVFQSYALFPHLSVSDNVAYGLKRKKVAKAEVGKRVDEALALVDLPEYGRRKPAQLSGGQRQRVALARALVNRPQVLLLDEPLGALDLKLRKQMQLELKRIQTEVGITFIYVTHDQEEAMTMSDRIAVMRGGRVEQIGVPEDIYENPNTEFVAQFLGASNLLDGKVKDVAGDTATVTLAGGEEVRMPSARLNGDSKAGAAVRVGVRPEKIKLVTGAEGSAGSGAVADGKNNVPGLLRMATFIGVSYQYTVEGPGGVTLTVVEQNLGDEPAASPGTKVQLRWLPENTFAVRPQAGLTKEEVEGE
ncbi:MAG: ABC transporter ATP-binding protein [Actinomycetota bacterium]